MTRPLRITFENAWYHVMNRGTDRCNIFQSEQDFDSFLQLLSDTARMYNAQFHAYCLMDNHYHLLVCTPDANLPRIMSYINSTYTIRFNRSKQRDGPLFRGRYKAKLIEDDIYLAQVSRYIHLNPVDAHMVREPEEYVHSSYRAYIGFEKSPTWLNTNKILGLMNANKPVQQYRNFISDGVDTSTKVIYADSRSPAIIGSDSFKMKYLDILERTIFEDSIPDCRRTKKQTTLTEVIHAVASYYNCSLHELLYTQRGFENQRRRMTIYLCRTAFGLKNVEIANAFGHLSSTYIAGVVYRLKKRVKKDKTFEDEVFRLMEYVHRHLNEE